MTCKLLARTALFFAVSLKAQSQGYIVPNGVSYAGTTLGPGYGVNVVHDPTNNYFTGFTLVPVGRTPSGAPYTNTFLFNPIVDVSVRVFLVTSNSEISLGPISAQSYPELTYTSIFDSGVPFYIGLYTGNMTYSPPDGIYNDPLFGWAELVNNRGVIGFLGGAIEYRGGGIYAGTQTIIQLPEPSGFALFLLGGLALVTGRTRVRTGAGLETCTRRSTAHTSTSDDSR